MTPDIPPAVIEVLKAYRETLAVKITVILDVKGSKRGDDRGVQWTIGADGVVSPGWTACVSTRAGIGTVTTGIDARDAVLNALRAHVAQVDSYIGYESKHARYLAPMAAAMREAWPEEVPT